MEDEDESDEEGNDVGDENSNDDDFEDNSDEDDELYEEDGLLYKSRMDCVDELKMVK